jgi:hypothetical protein
MAEPPIRGRTWVKAAVVLLLVGAGLALVRGRSIAHRAKEKIATVRRELRVRRKAQRLAAEGVRFEWGPDVRLPTSEVVFDTSRGLGPGWIDFGWTPHELRAGAPARLDLSRYGGLILANDGLRTAYGGLLFRYRAPEAFGDFLEVRLEAPDGTKLAPVRGIAARSVRQRDGFAEVWIPMRELNPEGQRFSRIIFHAWRDVPADPVEIQYVGLTAAPPPVRAQPRTGRFQIDCRAEGHPISPLIYGIATYFGDPGEQQWRLGATARRWGGNHSSRYNPDLHAWNLDRDWYFRNVPVRSAESFLEENRSHGLASALTVPILGWVAKDVKSYSFPVSVFGPQQAVAFDLPDAGNGVRPDGSFVPSPPPSATSVACSPECIERWIGRIRAAKEAGGAGVDLYILDNEPMIWHSTHRDVHPEPAGYDELLERTIAYGTAIRKADPTALIAGPAECCWLNLWFSAKDVAASVWLRPDRLRHFNVPLLPWYLRKLREHEARTGVHILDVVDVHFYPVPDVGPPTGGATDPATAALRIRTTRSLWDPEYVDESWIDEPMQLLPQLRRWIAENYPGRRISIGEWNFGAEDHISGGLAVAEALGRFGLEGIYSAFYWTYPLDRSPAYWAFRAYRNFDGNGGRFLDRSVPTSGGTRLASLFASRADAGTRLVAVVLNHDPASPLNAELELSGCGSPRAARAFSYSGGAGGFVERQVADANAGSTLHLAVDPYSIQVVDVEVAPSRP